MPDASPALPPQTCIVSPDWVDAQSLDDWLTAAEQERAQAFPSPARRRDWLAGRLAAKRLLLETWHISPLACTVGSDGLAPCMVAPGAGETLSHINWTVSHSHGWGAASWADARAEGTAGVDIQHIRPAHSGLAARIVGDAEHAALRAWRGRWGDEASLLLLWALKEAAIKARRLPWGRPLKHVQVQAVGPADAQISLRGEPDVFAGTWARAGEFWVARAVKPGAMSSRPSAHV